MHNYVLVQALNQTAARSVQKSLGFFEVESNRYQRRT